MRTRGVTLLLLTAFLVGAAGPSVVAQSSSPANSAALLEAENEVSAKRSGQSWQPSVPVVPLTVGDSVRTGELSRAAVRLTDLSVLRMNELTTIEILPREKLTGSEGVDIKNGAIYFFSRDRPKELRIETPVVTGALRGTEFQVAVEADGRTRVSMFDGEVELSNSHGRVLIRSGEQGEAARGEAPRKTAMIEAVNIMQWCLYYPAVVRPRDLGMDSSERAAISESLAAYNQGDLLGALEKYPKDHRAASAGGRLYHAAVLLAVGQVDKAQRELGKISSRGRDRLALEQMIAAVKYQDWSSSREPATVGEWLAQSYYLQSKGRLEEARAAASRATEVAPDFGYGWVRLAELQFSFGRTPDALKALEQGLQLTPRNAQGHALKGFLLSAENRIEAARESFEQAIRVDGALGNAWLGRGLTFIRQRKDELGRQDLEVAAVLEPNRAIFHSYLGKAFSQVGNVANANRELDRAIKIDPNDPTPWLYSAIEKKQENRYNEAIDDLEKSIELNDNRSIFRSRFLLDQDRSIRGTNLAAIYQNDGMTEQSLREAVRAVDDDYTSAPAHLFLANSYNALRDPDRVLLRYETAWFNELLLSNLLSPVGGGPLSQFVSEQEYSKMFERDGLGFSSVTDYFSYGEWRETASQYGTFGNFSYAVDTDYQFNDGLRPNNRIDRFETYGQFKLQLAPQDTLFFQTKFEDLNTGDVRQFYDQTSASTTLDFHEFQVPALLLLGWHHQWSPGNDLIVLVGRLENQQDIHFSGGLNYVSRDISNLTQGLGDRLGLMPGDFSNPFANPIVFDILQQYLGRGHITDLRGLQAQIDYHAGLEIYSAEAQNIFTAGPMNVIVGARCQFGTFDTNDLISIVSSPSRFVLTPAYQDSSVDFARTNLYAYDIWRITSSLSVTGGLTFDFLQYPDNFRAPPINDQKRRLNKLSPKLGAIWEPPTGTVVRAAYTEAISGASFDESIRLEPTQVAGFTQAYRSLVSESLIGEVAGSRYQFWGVSVEQKLPTRTYLGVEFDVLRQNVDQTIGSYDLLQSLGEFPREDLPSSLAVNDRYKEEIVNATINQLIGKEWSLGARYRYTVSHFSETFPELLAAATNLGPGAAKDRIVALAETSRQSRLHQLGLFALFNHPSGFFARAEANWYKQENDLFGERSAIEPGDDFWQVNLIAGYRFYRNQCEISAGVLDLNDADYQLNPLNPYLELPRSRTFALRAKLSF